LELTADHQKPNPRDHKKQFLERYVTRSTTSHFMRLVTLFNPECFKIREETHEKTIGEGAVYIGNLPLCYVKRITNELGTGNFFCFFFFFFGYSGLSFIRFVNKL
jgi:hypothetical protein